MRDMHRKGSIVTAAQPGTRSRRSRDSAFEETDYRDAIRMQARDARETARALRAQAQDSRQRARRAIDEARALSYLCALRTGALVGRCAWCERYRRIGGDWLTVTRSRMLEAVDVTHGICEDCISALRERGQSS